ncbi:Gfo/Idh/MocA family oxidoreductase [Streptomyces sp. B-S-A8]|uniref:Gfo/Idh/MocA family oxidoreductase n=1 Tax=Streptomyces solicavernae TaxID=3043614 RepID=A0ABT6RZY9_9ACTN|nr:Gfo/Idh/MocA family oxidoreductase [Streptomyces sp. B-S-A8]MDI3389895.1 Gfo/Idh/MocA family oxidoreductase [Streptomyces sp. B-S-A8]
MLRTLLIGLGRAGTGLHLPVLHRARTTRPELFADRPVVGVDPAHLATASGLHVVDSLRAARRTLDPDRTVVHLCTPPAVRGTLLGEAARLGFWRFVVEKPLATDRAALRRVLDVVDEHGLHVRVVSPWLHSALTGRIAELAGDPAGIRAVTVTQHKSRFRRTLTNSGHTDAFQVEIPHALGVLLRLLGDADVHTATCTDLRYGGDVVPYMGGARLTLSHATGLHSRIDCDLTSPVRRRRITVATAAGTRLVGHYPVTQDDDIAQLDVDQHGRTTRELITDDALLRCLTHAYRAFAEDRPYADELRLHTRTAELLDDARHLALATPTRTRTRHQEAAHHAG